MEKIDTSKIENWPEKVILGYARISDRYSKNVLSKHEEIEFSNFLNPKRQAEFLTARHLFRYLLEQSGLDLSIIKLSKHEEGKPFFEIEGEHAFVSFSHSQSHVFCALSKTIDMGLDVEQKSRMVNERVLKRILSEEEQGYLLRENPVQLWTIKEAAVKCMGTGLRTNLNEVQIHKNKKNRFSVRFNNEYYFEICSFKQLNHQIALAYQSQ